ncbi:MAG: hypothetical protein BWK80_41415 [Desulfobacteraceae bacterium IS3]|nr:MAG: hypothetical protein BWK80_41415 [Desulfobacteraceae bacterium IS3]
METGQLVQKYMKVADVWHQISSVLSPPQTEADVDRLIEFCDYLMDQTGGDKNHPLMGLLELAGTLISEFERENIPEPEGTPIGCLSYLMEEHGLKPEDMTELGMPDVVSEILSGQKELDKNQIKALSRRFGCSPAIFI